MANKLHIGMVGLGGIAQKVYLPFLSKEKDWCLKGAFTPNAAKRKQICDLYRIKDYASLSDLINECDAVFVHSSTSSHFEIVQKALKNGKDVYVDKPMASTTEEAEKLCELSVKSGRKLMVGFNRRFAPMYVEAKEKAKNAAWIRIEKHRADSVSEAGFDFTMMDDYIHIIDTARWFGEPEGGIRGRISANDKNQMLYALYDYETKENVHIFTGMHRKCGSNLEQLEIVSEDGIIRVKNMDIMETEKGGEIIQKQHPSWDTILKRRGFEDAIMHFINSVCCGTKLIMDGEEALKTQRLVEQIIKNN